MKLETRLLLLFAAVSLVFAGLISVSSRRAVHAVLVSNLESPAVSRAAEAERSMAVGLQKGNEKLLEIYLQGCLTGYGAAYASALGPDGTVLRTETSSNLSREPGARAPGWRPAPASPSSLETALGGREVLELILPAPGGGLLLGFDMTGILRTERQIGLKLFLFAGTAGGLGLGLLLLLMRDLARRYGEMSAELARTTVSKEYLTGVLDNMLDAVFVVDDGGRLRTVNPSLLRMLGYAEPELLGRAAAELFEPGADPGVHPMHNAELRMLRKDGVKIPVLFSSAALPPDGGAKGMVCAARDVAELRRKDAELKERETLLRQSDKLSALGRLAAGIAHEINNPLGSILGFAQAVLARLKEDDGLTVPLRGIEEEALRSRTLVQSLLSFSRQGPGASEVFDLGAAAEATLAMIEAQARVKGVEIVRELDAGARVRGDRGQIQQVVMNLSSNALDAMPRGGRLTVRAGERDGRAYLEVEDDGTGIADDVRGKIFDPFFTTKELGKGTGLGLSLVHEIVTRHRGTVEALRAPVRGALFRVVLPGVPAPGAG